MQMVQHEDDYWIVIACREFQYFESTNLEVLTYKIYNANNQF